MGNPLRVMVEVEREVLGLLKEFGEHSAGPYARDLLSGFDSRQIHQNFR